MDTRISRLFVYPIKGAAGIEVDAWDIDDFGFRADRRWMIVAGDGTFLSQRSHPRMAFISVELDLDGLRLSAPDQPTIAVRTPAGIPGANNHRSVTIWRDRVQARGVGRDADEWLSDFLRTDCSLVWMDDDAVRGVPHSATQQVDRDVRVGFADAFPFLLLSSESIDTLNARIGGSAPRMDVLRFRPNIVVTGAGPHAEDGWGEIEAGGIRFVVAKPCARCAVTTVNPETGKRGKEPLRTLSRYRLRDGQVYFGQNLVHASTGRLCVADSVTVLSTAESLV